ncbi:MAG TPA: hypothetical protein VGV37_21785 [Aliidongia sp.]|uniref:hypothetical protein n=1 Tax=Aliidongia sp. TaxID=1914230 RepID=UPI002DDC9CAD|nr:hypothetical protein [Aliidongia sp.]HEV2677174.1 hypothetical protein [Aliidongia sp.]
MSDLTITNFWKPRLNVARVRSNSLVRGWFQEESGCKPFMEAPLSLSDELSAESDPARSPVLLVSAPGAVGKSTLARQIAFETGAIYLDLAVSDAVGANTLSGGLARSGLFPHWQAGTTTALVDGLDEARLRVTQEAFEAFIGDVAAISKGRSVPTVLFGRTGAIQDTWLILAEHGIEAPVLEIGYYQAQAAADFAEARLRTIRPNSPFETTERKAIDLLLARLREQTNSDGDRFAGYAPVLNTVAERVADANPQGLIANVEAGGQPVTLEGVASAILDRERGKLNTLPFEDKSLSTRLYSPEEQLDRIVARLYPNVPDPLMPPMSPKDAQIYSSALATWVPDHPFLDGGNGTSSAVFEALISTRALKNPASKGEAAQKELRRGAAANPFLAEFYVPSGADRDNSYLPPEHVGIVYASLRARLSLGDSASLLVEEPEDAVDEEALTAEVEITIERHDSDRIRTLNFSTEQTGVLRLGAYVEDVEITTTNGHVEIGPGAESMLVAPISIQCNRLTMTAERVVIECPRGSSGGVVYLEANSFDGGEITSLPIVRGGVTLTCSWPTARSHPWTSFASNPTPKRAPKLDEALRRFRKFVIAFRSHSKGNLRRFKDKIEHARMTKGTGQAVLDLLKQEGILTLMSDEMYELDPDGLGSKTGATYADCMTWQFNPETEAFLTRAL